MLFTEWVQIRSFILVVLFVCMFVFTLSLILESPKSFGGKSQWFSVHVEVLLWFTFQTEECVPQKDQSGH